MKRDAETIARLEVQLPAIALAMKTANDKLEALIMARLAAAEEAK